MPAWMIVRDLFAERCEREGDENVYSYQGHTGPGPVGEFALRRLESGQGTQFRLLDDDGEIYATGIYDGSADDEGAFSPLEFGAANWGATEIQYRRGRRWETL